MHGLVSLKASTTEQLSILGGCQPRLAFEQRTERRRISVPHLLGDPFDAGAAVAEHCHLATDAATRHDLQATDFEAFAAAPICACDRGSQLVVMRSL